MPERADQDGQLIRWPSRAGRRLHGAGGGPGCRWRARRPRRMSGKDACPLARIRADRAALASAHQLQPGLRSAMISLDRVVRVPFDSVQRRGDQLVQDPRIGRCPIGSDLGRDGACAPRPGEAPPGRGQVPLRRQQHVDDLAMLVNCPVQTGQPAGNLHIRLIDESSDKP